jgi:hypothetical protein
MIRPIFKREYEEIRDRKLLEILKKDQTWGYTNDLFQEKVHTILSN